MKRNSFFSGSLALLMLASCQTTKQNRSSVIGKIGNDPIYANEFSYVYNKNNSNTQDAYSKESIEEYLRLYTNFRLKVKAAEELGLDTTESFRKELEGYKKQLAQPYFTEKEITEKLTRQAYERMKEEVNASHILISLKPEADPADTLKAWKKIMDIRSRAIKGEDFGQLAMDHSEDPSAKKNKGNLGYFTALQMVYQFEDAAFSTKKGDISEPVRTRFGYHILKVHDKRPSQGQVRVAHIMVRATEGMQAADSLAAVEKVNEIYKRLGQGEDWNDLTRQFSDDLNSKEKGGELQWFSTGRMIPSFEEASFALDKPGDFTKPVNTPYGWHIIKLLEKKPLESFEELESKIRPKVARDRADVNRKTLIERLKRENSFEEFPLVVKKATAIADSTLPEAKWDIPANAPSESVLFVINKQKYQAKDFYSYVKNNQKPKPGMSPQASMNALYEEYKEARILEYEEKNLPNKYEDYRMLVKEYRDGILLFQLMDEKVWSRAIEDTTGLRAFYEQNKEKYKWNERAQAVIFNAADKATLEKVKSQLSKDLYPANEPDLEPVYFAAGSDSLMSDEVKKLNKLIPYLNQKSELVLQINGQASSKEKLDQAQARIEKVMTYLVSKGIDKKRIVVGEAILANKDTDSDRNTTFKMFSTSAKVLERSFNKDAPLTLQVTEGMFQKGDNEILNEVKWAPDTTVIQKNDRYYLVVLKDIEAPRTKRLEEARGIIISDYQEHLEKEWIAQLKTKYPVSINESELNKIIKK